MQYFPFTRISSLLLISLLVLAGCTESYNPVDALTVRPEDAGQELDIAPFERAAAAKADRDPIALGKLGSHAYTFDDLPVACVWNRQFPETYHDLTFSGSRFLASCAMDGDLGLVPVNSREQNNQTQTNIRLPRSASEVSISYFGYRFHHRGRILVAYDEAGNEIDRAADASDGSWRSLRVTGSIHEVAIVDYQSQTVWDDLTITFEAGNTPPVADAGMDQTVIVTESVALDASSSSDGDGDPLAYAWSFVSRPDGSLAAFSDPHAPVTTFTADQPGSYIIQLLVDDGTAQSAPDEVEVRVLSAGDAVSLLRDDVDALETAGRLNRGQANSLRKMLDATLRSVERHPQAAISKLTAFSRRVESLIEGGVLSAGEGGALVDFAARIASSLETQAGIS